LYIKAYIMLDTNLATPELLDNEITSAFPDTLHCPHCQLALAGWLYALTYDLEEPWTCLRCGSHNLDIT
jgi:hypothetical protein